jgi:hypothetical protein
MHMVVIKLLHHACMVVADINAALQEPLQISCSCTLCSCAGAHCSPLQPIGVPAAVPPLLTYLTNAAT